MADATTAMAEKELYKRSNQSLGYHHQVPVKTANDDLIAFLHDLSTTCACSRQR